MKRYHENKIKKNVTHVVAQYHTINPISYHENKTKKRNSIVE